MLRRCRGQARRSTAFRAALPGFADKTGRLGLYLYAWVEGDERRIRARMFAPLSGTFEDPATGSAAATLAGLLTSLAPGDNLGLQYAIEQGVEMGRPSLIIASAVKTGEGPVSASVAGSCGPLLRQTFNGASLSRCLRLTYQARNPLFERSPDLPITVIRRGLEGSGQVWFKGGAAKRGRVIICVGVRIGGASTAKASVAVCRSLGITTHLG